MAAFHFADQMACLDTSMESMKINDGPSSQKGAVIGLLRSGMSDMCPVPTLDLVGSRPPPPRPKPRPLISNQALGQSESRAVMLPPRGGPRVRGTAVRGTGARPRSPSPPPLPDKAPHVGSL